MNKKKRFTRSTFPRDLRTMQFILTRTILGKIIKFLEYFAIQPAFEEKN